MGERTRSQKLDLGYLKHRVPTKSWSRRRIKNRTGRGQEEYRHTNKDEAETEKKTPPKETSFLPPDRRGHHQETHWVLPLTKNAKEPSTRHMPEQKPDNGELPKTTQQAPDFLRHFLMKQNRTEPPSHSDSFYYLDL